MPVRVGIDQLTVSAVSTAVAAHADRYLARVYTERELADCATPAGPSHERLAARFAAKEATLKVLRPGEDGGVPWRDIEVVRRPGGWVELELSGAASALAAAQGLTGLAVSLTHEAGSAAAVVVAQHPEETT